MGENKQTNKNSTISLLRTLTAIKQNEILGKGAIVE